MTDQTSTTDLTNPTQEWVPQPCDPDADLVRPEGVAEDAWELLSEFEQHTIMQHTDPALHHRASESSAFLHAAQARGISASQAQNILLASLILVVDDENFDKAMGDAVFKSEMLAQQSGMEALLKKIFGDVNADLENVFGPLSGSDEEEGGDAQPPVAPQN